MRKRQGNIVRTHSGKRFKDGKVKIKYFSPDNAGLKVKKYVQNCIKGRKVENTRF